MLKLMLEVPNGEFVFVRLHMPEKMAGFTGATPWHPDHSQSLEEVASLMLAGIDEFLDGQPYLDLQRPSDLEDLTSIKASQVERKESAVLGKILYSWPVLQDGLLHMRIDYIKTPDDHLRYQKAAAEPSSTLAQVVERAA